MLEGIRVLDLGQVYSAPLCAQMLGDLGADVIKLESVNGEWGRRDRCPWAGGEASLILQCNRNKRSVAVDLRNPAGREIVFKLVARSDVVVHNFRPGVMERVGLGYRELQRHNPRVIVGSISGYGPTGPYRDKKGQDLLAQAMSGALWLNSFAGHPPLPIGNVVADHGAARLLAYGIMAALFARERSGTGQEVSVSLLDAMVDLQLEPAFFYLNSGEAYRRGRLGRGIPVGAGVPYGVYRTKDDRWIAIAGELAEVCRALGMEDLSQDPRYDTEEKQKANRDAICDRVEGAVHDRTFAEAAASLDAADVWNAPVYDYAQTFADPQVRHNEMLIEVENPRGGTYKITGLPVKFSRTPARPGRRPPRLAEHTAEILRELGYSGRQIEELAEARVIALAGARAG